MTLSTRLCGVRLDAVGLEEAVNRMANASSEGRPLQVTTINTNFLTLARADREYAQVLERSDLNVVDGRLLLWLVQSATRWPTGQVTGHDLVRELLPVAARRSLRVFLMGGAPGVGELVAARIRREHPGIELATHAGGDFNRDGTQRNDDGLMAALRDFAPQLIFIALGAPKAERWIQRHLPLLPPAAAVGVGGVFDTLAGRITRAPRWMQVSGLEWLYRLVTTPDRYWRRYVLNDPPTLAAAIREVVSRKLGRR